MPTQRIAEEYPPKSGILIAEKTNPSGSHAYRVDIAASLTGATREQRQFPSKEKAWKYAKQRHAEIVRLGHEAFALTAQQRTDALKALAILRPHKLSLEDAAKHAASQCREQREQLNVSELYRRFMAAPGRRKGKAIPRRPLTVINLTWRLNRFEKQFGKRDASGIPGVKATDYMLNREVLSVEKRQRYQLTTKHAIRVRRAFQINQREKYAAKHGVYRKIADSIGRLTFDSDAALRYVAAITDAKDRQHRANVVEQLMLGEMVWATDQQGRNYTVLVSVPRDIRQFFSCGTEPLVVVDISSSQPLLHVLLYPSDSDEKRKYKALVEDGGFWSHMNKLAGDKYNLNDDEQKAELKEAIFREVFYAYRETTKGAKGAYAKLFKAEFPTLWSEINAHKKAKGYKASGALAKEMQRTEAWAVFDAINALRSKPYPLISIHDAIVTTQDGEADVLAALRDAFLPADLDPRLVVKRLTVEPKERRRIMGAPAARP